MKTTFYLLLLLFLNCATLKIAFAQNNVDIAQLKEGVLLVRLKTKINQIKSYYQAGNIFAAKEIELERRQYHRALVDAFRQNYNFSEVYFFFNRDAHKVFSGDFAGHLFDVHGNRIDYQSSKRFFYILDSYFPHNKSFAHQKETAGFIIKKLQVGGIADRISTAKPFVFPAPTSFHTVRQQEKFKSRIKDFNESLWEKMGETNHQK